MAQTDYPTKMDVALEGQLADIGPNTIGSYVAEGEGVGIGLAVVQGTEDNQCVAPSETGQDILGVVAHSHAREVDAPGEGDVVNVIRRGALYVRPEQAVAPGDPVYVRHTAGSDPGEVPGRFRVDADTDKADLWPGAQWRTSASAGGLAVLDVALSATVTVVEENGGDA